MTQITEEIVDATWKRFGALTPDELLKLQRRYGNTQPELIAFIVAFTEDQREDVVGVALYVFFCVLEMFRSARPRKLRRIRRKEVEAAWKANCDLARKLATTSEKTVPDAVNITPTEPHVLQYVFDALTEPEVEENVGLTEEEFGYLFPVLTTAVDCLHRA